MKTINIFSLMLALIFTIFYFLKLAILSKQMHIKANVLGKAGKERRLHNVEILVKITSFFGILLWLMESLFSKYLGQYIGGFNFGKGFTYLGLIFMVLGIVFFTLAIVCMKSSWRVGIDKQTKTELIIDGIYKISRNPAFVGFNLMFVGVFLAFPSVLTLICFVLNAITFHLLILQEEQHLIDSFETKYLEYKKDTPRYILLNLKY